MRRDALHANVVLRRIIFLNYVSCVVSGDELKPTLRPTPVPEVRITYVLAFLVGLILLAGVAVCVPCLFKRYWEKRHGKGACN